MKPSVEGATELESIWQLSISFLSRGAILTAAELGVFSLLARGPATEADIRKELALHERGSRDFLDFLVAAGMLERVDGQYQNTPMADRHFDFNKQTYLADFLRNGDLRWGQLAEALRTGEPQNNIGADNHMFEGKHRTTAAWQSFLNGMDYLNSMLVPYISTGFDWNRVSSFVDMGGARGNVAAHLVSMYPHLDGHVFDLPPVAEMFDTHMLEQGLTGRIKFVSGEFFADPLPETDVVLLAHVLHNWSRTQRRTLVEKAFHAIRPGGAVLICDPMIDDDRREKVASLLSSLNMMLVTPHGSEYTLGECRSWLTEAGAAEVAVPRLDSHDTLVIGWKRG